MMRQFICCSVTEHGVYVALDRRAAG